MEVGEALGGAEIPLHKGNATIPRDAECRRREIPARALLLWLGQRPVEGARSCDASPAAAGIRAEPLAGSLPGSPWTMRFSLNVERTR